MDSRISKFVTLTWYLLVSAIGVPSVIYFAKKVCQYVRILSEIESCKNGITYTISELKQLALDRQRSKRPRGFVLQNVLIQGIAHADDPLKFSEQARDLVTVREMKTKLLREVYTRQEVELSEISRFSLKLSEDLENEKMTRNRLYQVRQVERIQLADKMFDSTKSIETSNLGSAIFFRDVYNFEKTMKKPLSVMENLQRFFNFCRVLLGWEDQSKAMNQVALMDGLLSLTVGSYLTMLCDVGIKRGKVQIKSVKYVTSMSQNVILQYLRKQGDIAFSISSSKSEQILFKLMISAFVVTVFLSCTFCFVNQQLNQNREIQNAAQNNQLLSKKQSHLELSEQNHCIVCLENTRCVIFAPCSHFLTCQFQKCSRKLKNKCPVCRQLIDSFIKVNVK